MKVQIKEDAISILDAIVKVHGIDIIEEFKKRYNKQLRKQQKRVNNYEEVACDVYYLIHNSNYSKTRAIEEVAKRRSIVFYTVRNHCTTFDKEAKEFDFYSFGALVDKVCDVVGDINQSIYSSARSNHISNEVARVYYDKYTNHPKKKIIPIVNIDKFEKPFPLSELTPF